MEKALKQYDFNYCRIVKFSPLLHNRRGFRIAEKMAVVLFKVFSFIFVAPIIKYRSVYADDAAKIMMVLTHGGLGKVILKSNIIKQITDEYTKQK